VPALVPPAALDHIQHRYNDAWPCPLSPFESRLKVAVGQGRSYITRWNPRKAINHKDFQPWQRQLDLVGPVDLQALIGGADDDGLLRFVEVGKTRGEGGHWARHS
jgi:hypothetical protein